MANVKKTATKGSKTTTANASKKQVLSTAIADKVSKIAEAEDKAKALTALDRLVAKISNEILAETKDKVLGLSNWVNTYKGIAVKYDSRIAEQFKDNQKWFHFIIEVKMNLDHVVVLTEGKDKETGKPTVIRSIKPCMWLKKTDKVSLPDYFGKAKVGSYRYGKVSDKEVTISDGKELEVTRSVKTPKMVVVTDAEGNQFKAKQLKPNAEGIMKPVYEEKDVVFVPYSQLDFTFDEVKEAIKKAMLTTFGSAALEAK